MRSLIGGSVAGRLIKKYDLKGNTTDVKVEKETVLGKLTDEIVLFLLVK